MILEKFGTPNEVDDFIKKYWKYIQIGLSEYKSFNFTFLKKSINISLVNDDRHHAILDSDKLFIEIFYPINYDELTIVKNLAHELTHIYELSLIKDYDKSKWKWQEAINRINSKNKNNIFRYITDMIYLSLPQELNARVSSIYYILSGSEKSKQMYILKNSNEWKNHENLLNFPVNQIFNDLNKYEFTYVSDFFTKLNHELKQPNTKFNSWDDILKYLKKWDTYFQSISIKYKNKLLKVLFRTKNEEIDDPKFEQVRYELYIKHYQSFNRDWKIDQILIESEFKKEFNKVFIF
jgi:ribosomal protein S17E